MTTKPQSTTEEPTNASGKPLFPETLTMVACDQCDEAGPWPLRCGHTYVGVHSREYTRLMPLLGYERVITIEWDKHNARRHKLIEAKRSRPLSDEEVSELRELQWLAGIKRELLTGPVEQSGDGFPCYCRCHVQVTIRQQSCVHCNLYLAYPPSITAQIAQIADLGSAEEFGDALERLRGIRKLIDEHEGAR